MAPEGIAHGHGDALHRSLTSVAQSIAVHVLVLEDAQIAEALVGEGHIRSRVIGDGHRDDHGQGGPPAHRQGFRDAVGANRDGVPGSVAVCAGQLGLGSARGVAHGHGDALHRSLTSIAQSIAVHVLVLEDAQVAEALVGEGHIRGRVVGDGRRDDHGQGGPPAHRQGFRDAVGANRDGVPGSVAVCAGQLGLGSAGGILHGHGDALHRSLASVAQPIAVDVLVLEDAQIAEALVGEGHIRGRVVGDGRRDDHGQGGPPAYRQGFRDAVGADRDGVPGSVAICAGQLGRGRAGRIAHGHGDTLHRPLTSIAQSIAVNVLVLEDPQVAEALVGEGHICSRVVGDGHRDDHGQGGPPAHRQGFRNAVGANRDGVPGSVAIGAGQLGRGRAGGIAHGHGDALYRPLAQHRAVHCR